MDGVHKHANQYVTMAMVKKVMAMVGCTNKLFNKNGNGHRSYGKDVLHL